MRRVLTACVFGLVALGDPTVATAQPRACPPGLAKKSPECVPPGQAKRTPQPPTVGTGQIILEGFVLLPDPQSYGLDPAFTYYRKDGRVLRVDPDTQAVIDVINGIMELSN